MKYEFNAKQVKEDCVQWIREWFADNGEKCNAIIGLSGGKDSAIVAALCKEALGYKRVVGVLMPDGEQSDIQDAIELAQHLGIYYITADISKAVDGVFESLVKDNNLVVSVQAENNLPPRIRMATLYAVAQSMNGRVANTCNLSEEWVGYSTKWGDNVGDFSPLAPLTVAEVKAVGYELGLPEHLIEKTPADGLTGLSDEENLGFTYDELDTYLRTGECDEGVKSKIDAMHEKNKYKMYAVKLPSFYKYFTPVIMATH